MTGRTWEAAGAVQRPQVPVPAVSPVSGHAIDEASPSSIAVVAASVIASSKVPCTCDKTAEHSTLGMACRRQNSGSDSSTGISPTKVENEGLIDLVPEFITTFVSVGIIEPSNPITRVHMLMTTKIPTKTLIVAFITI